MPRVNKLNNSKPAAPASKPTVGPKGGAGAPPKPNGTGTPPKPVAAVPVNSGALAKAAAKVSVPAFLQTVAMPDLVPGGVAGGYVGFADPKSKKYRQMVEAGCEHGDPFVYHEQQYHRVNPLEFFLLMGDSFRTTMEGQDGKFTFVTRDVDTPLREIAASYPDKAKSITDAQPHYTALILVKLGDSLVPVKADFRGTKSGAGSSAIIAVKSAGDPEWLRLSEAHKVTAAFHYPWGRVWNSVTTKYKVGKGSGNDFFVANCVSRPATVDQMNLLVQCFQDDDWVAKLNEAEATYRSRVEYLDGIAAKLGESEEGEGENEKGKTSLGQPVPF